MAISSLIARQQLNQHQQGMAGLFALLLLVLLVVCPERTCAQSTAFSYQGKLSETGAPANGTYDFQVSIYDAASGGSQVGSVLTADDVVVTGGLFTLYPDFVGGVFDGQPRWLEVAVRAGASTGAFTTLTPRQPVLATPYAQRALFAAGVPSGSIGSSQLAAGAVGASQIADGSITAAKLASGVGGGSSAPAGTIVGAFEENAAGLLADGYVKVPGLFTEVGGWNKVITLSTAPVFTTFEAAWTGTEWFCLGEFGTIEAAAFGYGDAFGYLPARFNPATGLWSQANTNNGPQFSGPGTVVQLVAAGAEIYALGTPDSIEAPEDAFGWRYNTVADSWTMISTNGFGRLMDSGTFQPFYLWTGDKLFALGQPTFYNPEEPVRVGLYDPATTSWSLPSIEPVVNLNFNTKPIVAWTGTQVLVYGTDEFNFEEMVAARLDPATGSWTTMSTVDGPGLSSMGDPHPVWTGTELFVEGREGENPYSPVFYLYNPQTDTWRQTTQTGAPRTEMGGLYTITSLWTGTEVAVIYSTDQPTDKKTTVALYNPQTDSWRSFTDTTLLPDTMPGIGGGHNGVWVNGEALVIGKFYRSAGEYISQLSNYRFAPPKLLYLYQKQ